MDVNKFIGSKIRRFREIKNITQEELAEYLETTPQTISRYEIGERRTNNDILFKLAEYFDISINEFFPPTTYNNSERTYMTTIYKDDTSSIEIKSDKPLSSLSEEEQQMIIQRAMDELYEFKRDLKKKEK